MNLKNLKSKPKSDDPGVTLVPGAYICKIVRCEIDEEKGKVKLYIDIAKGQLTGYFQVYADHHDHKWNNGGIFTRRIFDGEFLTNSYESLIVDLEKSNPMFEYDEENVTAETFEGLYCGFIFGEEEYVDKFGNVRSIVRAKFNIDTQKVKDGKFKIPPKQTVDKDKNFVDKAQELFKATDAEPIDDNDVPF